MDIRVSLSPNIGFAYMSNVVPRVGELIYNSETDTNIRVVEVCYTVYTTASEVKPNYCDVVKVKAVAV